MQVFQNRRRFLTGLSATGAAGLIGAPDLAYAEPPPENRIIAEGTDWHFLDELKRELKT